LEIVLNKIEIMSSKATIFLTRDNEHCYEECNESHYEMTENEEKFQGYTIILEMSKKNIDVVCNDGEDLIIEIKPNCELYRHILKMKE
jgi:hypothetical protein